LNNIKSKDMAMAEEAKQAKMPYWSYIKKPVEGVQRGTKACLENFLEHMQKECYEHPLPVKEMNLPSKKELENSKLKLSPKLVRLRGMNICEITNKLHYARNKEERKESDWCVVLWKVVSTLKQIKQLIMHVCIWHHCSFDIGVP
jgi:hypothetical protein